MSNQVRSIENKIFQNVSLAPFTTFKIGGLAKFFIEIANKEELIATVEWVRENKEKIFILAGGSNILVNDKGVNGLVVKIKNNSAMVKGERIECGAGAGLATLVNLAAQAGLTGLEWAAGIPGTIGGAIRGNAGAFGEYIGKQVETIEIFNINPHTKYLHSGYFGVGVKQNKFKQFSRNDCGFGYRDSIFKKDANLLIWQIILKLEKGERAEIKNRTDGYLKYRSATQPNLPSAGSIFKNLLFDYLKNNNPYLSELALEKGVVKNGQVGVGWIIDLLDIKGKAIGGAKISLEHANFIVNTGKATAEDVITLIGFIKQQARDKFGVQLEEEIQYLGF